MPMQLSNIQEQLGNKESYLYEYLFKIQGEKKKTQNNHKRQNKKHGMI